MVDTNLAKAEAAPMAEIETSRAMRILVIDDNELDRQRVLRLCQQAGLVFESEEVASLSDLDNVLNANSFDLIFVDYLLTGETGLDALDMLAAHNTQSSAAAIMLAGEGQISIAVEAMRRGCSDYLTKSMMNVDTLQKSIAMALERRMVFASLEDERNARADLEKSISEYANACTAEMRSILSATLRRVRKLRSYNSDQATGYSIDLNTLEHDIDRMWGALPDFQKTDNLLLLDKSKAITENSTPQ